MNRKTIFTKIHSTLKNNSNEKEISLDRQKIDNKLKTKTSSFQRNTKSTFFKEELIEYFNENKFNKEEMLVAPDDEDKAEDNQNLNNNAMRYVDALKYLDLELQLRNEEQNSFDENHFNLEKNYIKYLKKAFITRKEEISFWNAKYEGVIDELKLKTEFVDYCQNQLKKSRKPFAYSYNITDDDINDFNSLSIESSYFTKFITLLNLFFRISYTYRYPLDIGYKVSFF